VRRPSPSSRSASATAAAAALHGPASAAELPPSRIAPQLFACAIVAVSCFWPRAIVIGHHQYAGGIVAYTI
jgi:hypothetical protein